MPGKQPTFGFQYEWSFMTQSHFILFLDLNDQARLGTIPFMNNSAEL